MRVLLCVDDDVVLDAVLAAADWSVETTKWDEVFVFHVGPRLTAIGEGTQARIDAFLSKVTERLSHLPVELDAVAATGDPAEAIVRAADDYEVDLIVMGARGANDDFPVGSVSQKVVTLSDCDVLVVRAARGRDPSDGFGAIVAVDGSHGSEAGIDSFITKLRAQRATIRLVHVVESMPSLWAVGSGEESLSRSLIEHAEALLARAASRFEVRGLEANTEWCRGSAAAQILDSARRYESELIVVGSRGHSRLTQLVLGSMTQRILRHAPCSVLCARAWAPESVALRSGWLSEDQEPQLGMA